MKRWRSIAVCVLAVSLVACESTGGGRGGDVVHNSWTGKGPRRNRLQEGLWTYQYNPELTPRAKGHYRSDRQVGTWEYWNKDQQLAWRAQFHGQTFKLNGLNSFYWEDGKPRTQGFFDAGEKEGHWTFWSSDGAVAQQGVYEKDRRALRWTSFHSDGSRLAEGYRLNDEKVGRWQFWQPGGAAFEEVYDVPAGYALVREEWDDGTPQREGFLSDGRPTGMWATSHSGGSPRMVGSFVDGRADGNWVAWTASGTPLAAGPMKDGEPTGTWRIWSDGGEKEMRGRYLDVVAFTGSWSPDVLPATDPETVVGTWLGEALAPPHATEDIRATEAALPKPPADLVAAVDSKPRIPILPQPFTESEVEKMEDIYEMYTVGLKETPSSRKYPKLKERRNDAIADPIEGKPLSWTKLKDAEGRTFDVNEMGGKVMLVILRGFYGQICVYCTYQVRALAEEDFQEAFRLQGAQIVVVYPGTRDDLMAFQQAYEDETQGLEIPFTIAYDEGFRLVDALGIRAELARPTTLIVEEGKVHYAYVSQDLVVDRPSATELIEALKKMN